MESQNHAFAHSVALATRPNRSANTTYTVDAATGRLGISQPGVRKLIKSGIMPALDRWLVDDFAASEDLVVTNGELAVLRTSEASPSGDPGRSRKGFDIDMTDEELAAACLMYWYCAPARIITNGGLLIVSVSTIPVAVYNIYHATEHNGRQELHGDLLGRYAPEADLRISDGLSADEKDMITRGVLLRGGEGLICVEVAVAGVGQIGDARAPHAVGVHLGAEGPVESGAGGARMRGQCCGLCVGRVQGDAVCAQDFTSGHGSPPSLVRT